MGLLHIVHGESEEMLACVSGVGSNVLPGSRRWLVAAIIVSSVVGSWLYCSMN